VLQIPPETHAELGRILADLAQRVKDGQRGGKILDLNGNACGSWEITRDALRVTVRTENAAFHE